MHLHCPLLMRGIPYYELEWQMDFPNAEDTYYLAHCYPYTFTDLKEDLDAMLNNPERRQWIKREVLCETRAGNSCFLVTCTNFGNYHAMTDFNRVELFNFLGNWALIPKIADSQDRNMWSSLL